VDYRITDSTSTTMVDPFGIVGDPLAHQALLAPEISSGASVCRTER
jgi:hypothetical protein